MKTFFDFLRRYNYFFLFLLLEVISFVMLFKFNSYQGSVWYTAANQWVAKINRSYADTKTYFSLGSVNTNLTRRNMVLSTENELLRQQIAQLRHDTTKLERALFDSLQHYDLLDAQVVSSTLYRTNNYLVIDKGSKDGVKAEMGVVGDGVAAGIVYLVGKNYSLVIPLINEKSSISCRVRGKNYFGYLEWHEKDPMYATLTEIPRYAKVKKGEVVETSGYSGIFPPGLFIGKVSDLQPSPDRQNFLLKVHLGIDYATLRNVCVVKTPYKSEIDTLLHKGWENDN